MPLLFFYCMVITVACFTYIGIEVAEAYGHSIPSFCAQAVNS